MILISEYIKILCAHMCTGILCMYSVLKRRWGRLANKNVLSSNFQCLSYLGGGRGWKLTCNTYLFAKIDIFTAAEIILYG